MKYYKKITLYTIVLILTMNFLIINTIADPVTNIAVIPDEPEPLSTVTITVNMINDDIIEQVYLKIKECSNDICFSIENISMELDGEKYSIDYKLTHSDATFFTYWLNIKSEGSWYETEHIDVYLKIEAENGDNDGNKGIPGFEIIIFIAALFITYIVIKKKR